jgi:hypothetical protein
LSLEKFLEWHKSTYDTKGTTWCSFKYLTKGLNLGSLTWALIGWCQYVASLYRDGFSPPLDFSRFQCVYKIFLCNIIDPIFYNCTAFLIVNQKRKEKKRITSISVYRSEYEPVDLVPIVNEMCISGYIYALGDSTGGTLHVNLNTTCGESLLPLYYMS